MKKYRLIYLTKKNDTLWEERIEAFSIRDARQIAALKLATTSHNELHKIIVRRFYGNN